MQAPIQPTTSPLAAALRPVAPATARPLGAPAPADGFRSGAVSREVSRLDLLNLTAAGSATAAGIAALSGGSDLLVGVLGVPALVAAPIATGALLLRKDAGAMASKGNLFARVASVSVTVAGALALAGAGETAVAAAALPALVAAPVALGIAACKAWQHRHG